MLPVSRRDEHLYSVPKFDLGKGDIEGFMNELVGFHEQFVTSQKIRVRGKKVRDISRNVCYVHNA